MCEEKSTLKTRIEENTKQKEERIKDKKTKKERSYEVMLATLP